MTVRCTDLDAFFDGELGTDQAAEFRHHLVTCKRCEIVLHGRMLEAVAADGDDPPIGLAADPPPADQVAEPADATPGAATGLTTAAAASTPATRTAAGASIEASDPRPRRSVIVYLAPVLAAAAAVPLLCFIKHDDGPLAMGLEIVRGGRVMRAEATRGAANVGDILHPAVRGERHRALWVYLDDRDLVVACPNDERCTQRGSELSVDVRLRARGRYTVIGLGSDDVIPVPTPGEKLDNVLAGQHAGIHVKRDTVDVD